MLQREPGENPPMLLYQS